MKRNLTMLTDFYQLTMLYGYSKTNQKDKEVVFDLFYRGAGNPYAVACGLEQIVDYIKNLKFTEQDIKYLRQLDMFDEEFFDLLRNFKFTGDIYAVEEGTIVFPYEPLIVVKAPLYQAQFIETAILCIFNHQTLIATKALKMAVNANGGAIAEFGLRRAQGPDAGIYGARASIIGGCASTSNVFAAKEFKLPISGTHSHSWIMSFPSELEAFRAYAKIFPKNCILLVDTYNTLKSGVPNAIKVFDEMKKRGEKPIGIRLDSGDLAYLSKKAREMLDKAGHKDVIITASSDIDENILRSLLAQSAAIDAYGIGTKLITSDGCPSLGGVYKLAAAEDKYGVLVPKIKFSDTPEKVTNPGFKKLVRFYDKKTNKALADLIALNEEDFSDLKEIEIFDPIYTWKRKKLKNFKTKDLLVQIFDKGKLVYKLPSIKQIKKNVEKHKTALWEEYIRDVNPNTYKVDLSQNLYDLKQKLILENLNNNK